MFSISSFARMLKTLPPRQQVFNLLIVAVGLWVFAALYYSQLRVYAPVDVTRLVNLEGRVNGHASSWEHDPAIVTLGITFRLNGARHVKAVYVNQAIYQQTGLRIGSKVLLTVEVGEPDIVLRELATQEGLVVFDDDFNRQIIEWNNESIWRNVVLLALVSFAPFFVALRVAWKHRRTLFQ